MWNEGEAHEDDTELKMDRKLTDRCTWYLYRKNVQWLYNSQYNKVYVKYVKYIFTCDKQSACEYKHVER